LQIGPVKGTRPPPKPGEVQSNHRIQLPSSFVAKNRKRGTCWRKSYPVGAPGGRGGERYHSEVFAEQQKEKRKGDGKFRPQKRQPVQHTETTQKCKVFLKNQKTYKRTPIGCKGGVGGWGLTH